MSYTKQHQPHTLTISILLTLLHTTISEKPHGSLEHQLLHHLQNNYSPIIRPVLNRSHPTIVKFGFELKHILSIVESQQTITLKVWMRMSWRNELMTWTPTKWDNITTMRLDYNSVWTPDIFLIEDIGEDVSAGSTKYETHVIMQHNGMHLWLIPVLLSSSCTFNVAEFPFDHQSCTLVFTSWTHDEYELEIRGDERPVLTKEFVNSSEWDVVATRRERTSIKWSCCPNNYTLIKFTVDLRRKPFYYIYNLLIPCVIQMFVILFTFFIPPQTGERIGVVITVVLVFAVYLEVLSGSLPKTSTTTPVLSRFFIAAMAESALSIVATCCVLVVHFKGMEKGAQPLPNWIRKFILDNLSRYVLIEHAIIPDEGQVMRERRRSRIALKEASHVESEDDEEEVEKCNKNNNNSNNNHKTRKGDYLRPRVLPKKDSDMQRLLNEMNNITEVVDRMNRHDEIEAEWKALAKVLDRLFFVIFLIIFIVSSGSVILFAL